jgi:cell division protein FtsI/penicillin-binding protein 2
MQEKLKIYSVLGVCGLMFIYLLCVLYKLQIVNYKYYTEKRETQNKFFNKSEKRGTIFAERKDGALVPLALDENWYRLVISPKDVPTSYGERLYDLLMPILTKNSVTSENTFSSKVNKFLDKETFLKKLKNKNDTYEEVALINKEQAEKIEDLDIFGVYTNKAYKRVYPEKEFAAKIVGFVGDGESGITGKYGLEKFYQSELSGGDESRHSFFSQIFSGQSSTVSSQLSQDVVTTIEPNVSKFLYELLGKMKEEWAADTVAAIVMKVDTGEIVAMESLPTYDPNNYSAYSISNFNNPSVNGVYELGSIMKPITMSAGINEKLVTPATVYHDYGFVKVDEYTIKNFDEKVRGDQTMQDVISNSLNTGAVFVQQKLGIEKFKKYFDNFGFKENTEIDYPNEAVNLISNLDGNVKVNFATAAFGQGVAVTPISMLTALNIIVNGGKKVCPHLLKYKLFSDNTKLSFCRNKKTSCYNNCSYYIANRII